MPDPAARFLGNIPKHYDASLGPRLFAGYADDLARRVAALNPQAVLELAAGTGIVTRKLRDVLKADCLLVATDLNGPMLDVAKAKFGPGESVQFREIDATNLAFEDAVFDVVTCQFSVMFFPDKDRSYAQVHRVLKPGGSYVLNVWDSWSFNPFARITHETVAAFFPDDPPGFYRVPFAYSDEAVIRASLARAGFDAVNVLRLALRSAIPSAADFAMGLVFGNPLYDEIILRRGDPVEIARVVAQAIEAQLGADMPLQALVIHAQKG